jgi:hypothetical protein
VLESIARVFATVAGTTDTASTVQRWLVDGGLTMILGAVFYVGRIIGRVNQTLSDLAHRLQSLEDDRRDRAARSYGKPPRQDDD